MQLIYGRIDDKMAGVAEVREELKFTQKNMLKAKANVEDLATKIKVSEG